MKLEFFYDIASPYTYLASTQVEAVAADAGAEVRWRPMLLGGVFKATGNTMPGLLPPRARYMLRDLERWAGWYGVSLRFPTTFPPRTLTMMRALTALEGEARVAATHAAFHACWVHDAALDDPAVVAEVAGAEAAGRASDPAIKDALRETTEEAVARGVFGAPTFFVGDEMFFGNDRLPFVGQALRAT